MTAAVMEFFCRKAMEAKMKHPPCDLRCETTTVESGPKPKKGKESEYECDLRCNINKQFPEYVGPVHYSILSPPEVMYHETMIETALMNVVYFLMGATVMIILFHTLAMKHFWPVTFHILLITIGSQVLIPVAFQLLNPLDGAAIWMKWMDRQKQSCILRLVGIGCIWFSTLILICFGEYLVITFHSFFGFLCVISCIADGVALFMLYKLEDTMICRFERFICVPTFLLSSIAFISGLFRSSMLQWYPSPRYQIPVFLMLFCAAYTAIVVFRPIKCFMNVLANR